MKHKNRTAPAALAILAACGGGTPVEEAREVKGLLSLIELYVNTQSTVADIAKLTSETTQPNKIAAYYLEENERLNADFHRKSSTGDFQHRYGALSDNSRRVVDLELRDAIERQGAAGKAVIVEELKLVQQALAKAKIEPRGSSRGW